MINNNVSHYTHGEILELNTQTNHNHLIHDNDKGLDGESDFPPLDLTALKASEFIRRTWEGLENAPFKNTIEILDNMITFSLNPYSGKVLITIPPSPTISCLSIDKIKEIYSSRNTLEEVEIEPNIKEGVVGKVYVFEDSSRSWSQNYSFELRLDKITPPPSIIPKEKRSQEINELALNQPAKSSVIEEAESWIGKGNYIIDAKGISVYESETNTTFIQDLKVVAFCATGDKLEVFEESKKRIENKTANLNCWQFSILTYIQAGLISEKLAGKVFKTIDHLNTLDPKLHRKLFEAIKCGKHYPLNYLDSPILPKEGDILLFSSLINTYWHSAIFKEFNKEEQTVTYIENTAGVWGVRKKTVTLDQMELLIFVRSEDVQDNLMNYLAHHG